MYRNTAKRLTILAVVTFLMSWISPAVMAEDDLLDLSLDDLLDVEVIEAVTKKPERLFESPLAVSILRQEEMIEAGATSIPEALRLIPGMIVREQSPGNFDVHLRGFDNATTNSMLPFPSNSITLVMVDYRIVYNYFAGGTFWETLPIDIHDIEQIEVIRGPSSALYGPNAVAGVINIVTKENKRQGVYSNSNVQVGQDDNKLFNASFGYNYEKKFSAIVSTNYSTRFRDQSEFYEWDAKDFNDLEDLSTTLEPDEQLDNLSTKYPKPDRSLDRLGVNSFMRYNLSRKSHLEISAGYQQSEAMKVLVNNFSTPMTTNTSETYYLNTRGSFGNWHNQVAFTGGTQETDGMPDWKYDLNVVDAVSEYDLEAGKFNFRPGLSFRTARYNGSFIGGKQTLTNFAASMLTDWHPTGKLRVLGAGRVDKYNNPDDMYFSFQLSSTYSFSFNNMVRGAIYYANSAPFMLRTYIDHSLPLELAEIRYSGNTDMNLMKQLTYELGWRRKFSRSLSMDFEVFMSQMDDFSNIVFDGATTENDFLIINYQYMNNEMSAKQYGATVRVDIAPWQNLDLTAHMTVQETDYDVASNSLSSDFDESIKSTPQYFGGMTANFQATDRLNLNANVYYTSQQEYAGLVGETEVHGRAVVNARLAYQFWKGTEAFVNVRNAFGGDEPQYGYTDDIDNSAYFGLRWNY